jgi:hypothetical protein
MEEFIFKGTKKESKSLMEQLWKEAPRVNASGEYLRTSSGYIPLHHTSTAFKFEGHAACYDHPKKKPDSIFDKAITQAKADTDAIIGFSMDAGDIMVSGGGGTADDTLKALEKRLAKIDNEKEQLRSAEAEIKRLEEENKRLKNRGHEVSISDKFYALVPPNGMFKAWVVYEAGGLAIGYIRDVNFVDNTLTLTLLNVDSSQNMRLKREIESGCNADVEFFVYEKETKLEIPWSDWLAQNDQFTYEPEGRWGIK